MVLIVIFSITLLIVLILTGVVRKILGFTVSYVIDAWRWMLGGLVLTGIISIFWPGLYFANLHIMWWGVIAGAVVGAIIWFSHGCRDHIMRHEDEIRRNKNRPPLEGWSRYEHQHGMYDGISHKDDD